VGSECASLAGGLHGVSCTATRLWPDTRPTAEQVLSSTRPSRGQRRAPGAPAPRWRAASAVWGRLRAPRRCCASPSTANRQTPFSSARPTSGPRVWAAGPTSPAINSEACGARSSGLCVAVGRPNPYVAQSARPGAPLRVGAAFPPCTTPPASRSESDRPSALRHGRTSASAVDDFRRHRPPANQPGPAGESALDQNRPTGSAGLEAVSCAFPGHCGVAVDSRRRASTSSSKPYRWPRPRGGRAAVDAGHELTAVVVPVGPPVAWRPTTRGNVLSSTNPTGGAGALEGRAPTRERGAHRPSGISCPSNRACASPWTRNGARTELEPVRRAARARGKVVAEGQQQPDGADINGRLVRFPSGLCVAVDRRRRRTLIDGPPGPLRGGSPMSCRPSRRSPSRTGPQ